MAYDLEALIAPAGVVHQLDADVPVVALDQGFVLIPLTERAHADFGGEPVLRFYALTDTLAQWAASLSKGHPVGYLDAEFFGGEGFQAAVGWLDGAIEFGPRFTQTPNEDGEDWYEVVGPGDNMAANELLRFMGVEASDHADEFDTLGLGRFRSTDEWAAGASR